MASVKNVANYILSLSNPDVGDYISNLKLQKLLYYAQGYHLAIFNKPLFEDEIEAWEYGPVVRSMYYAFRESGSSAIEPPSKIDDSEFSDDQKDLLKEVYDVLGQFSALKLMDMTHKEPPWRNTPKNNTISHAELKEYFKTELMDD